MRVPQAQEIAYEDLGIIIRGVQSAFSVQLQ